jgi:hypothetical protein
VHSFLHPLSHLRIADALNTLLFVPKREEIRGEWGDLYNEGLHTLYTSANTVVKSRKMRSVKHVAHMGEMRNILGILVGAGHGSRAV